MMNPPGQGNYPPKRGPGGQLPQAAPAGRGKAGGQGVGGKADTAVGAAGLPGPGGRQLAARVSSGAITGEQAQRTLQQRQTLQKALGPNWREQLQVGGKSFADVNKGLKANPQDPTLAALRKKLLTNRQSVLERARKKNKGGQETEGED